MSFIGWSWSYDCMMGYGYGKFCIDMFKNGRDLVFIGDVICGWVLLLLWSRLVLVGSCLSYVVVEMLNLVDSWRSPIGWLHASSLTG